LLPSLLSLATAAATACWLVCLNLGLLGRMSSQGQEHVVQSRTSQCDVINVHTGRIKGSNRLDEDG
jgi:hypothetical protein